MPYYEVQDFAVGVDLRRHTTKAPAGSLRVADNVHVTPGGEIEKRPAFETLDIDLTGTFGLAEFSTWPDPLEGFESVVAVFTTNRSTAASFGTRTVDGVAVVCFLVGGDDLQLPPSTPRQLVQAELFGQRLYVLTFARDSGGDPVYEHFYGEIADAPDPKFSARYIPGVLGHNIRTFGNKMYALWGQNVYFSDLFDPRSWSTNGGGSAGGGFIDTSASDGATTILTGVEPYFDRLAVFGRRGAQIWSMDADPENNTLVQSLREIGSPAGLTAAQYGTGDVLFLSESGVRSLQARDSSNLGIISDVGSPVDSEITKLVDAARFSYYDPRTQAFSVVERTGERYWLVTGSAIWVLSLFPGPNITAWTRYLPVDDTGEAFTVQHVVSSEQSTYLRSAEGKLYRFGSAYDATEAVVVMPHLSFERPLTEKTFHGFDVLGDGEWAFGVSPYPEAPVFDPIGVLPGQTQTLGRVPLGGTSVGLTLRATSTFTGPAKLASCAFHYDLSESD